MTSTARLPGAQPPAIPAEAVPITWALGSRTLEETSVGERRQERRTAIWIGGNA